MKLSSDMETASFEFVVGGMASKRLRCRACRQSAGPVSDLIRLGALRDNLKGTEATSASRTS